MTKSEPMFTAPFDLDVLEKEVADTIAAGPVIPIRQQMPVPSPVERAVDEGDIGRLSAEAVQAQYEAAALSVEQMSAAVRKRMEATLSDCDAEMGRLADAAAAIREKGKQVYLQIERDSALSKAIQHAIDDVKKRMDVK